MNTLKRIFTDDIELAFGGILTFFIAFFVYLWTVAPTVSLWDCGEFIASSYILGVPHPPGAPFYLLLGRIFSLLPIGQDIGFRVNLISVLSSASTILFLYLIIIQLIRSFRGAPKDLFDKCIIYGSGSIGALTLAFSYTFWFNAVEAEVYAPSMLFTSATLWLALRWYEHRENIYSIRNLLIIVYLIGLSYGVHLLNVLITPAVILLIWFNKPRFIFEWRLWLYAMAIASCVMIIVSIILSGTITNFTGLSGSLIILNTIIALVIGALIADFRLFGIAPVFTIAIIISNIFSSVLWFIYGGSFFQYSIYFTLAGLLVSVAVLMRYVSKPKYDILSLYFAFSCASLFLYFIIGTDSIASLNGNLGTWELPVIFGFSKPLFVFALFLAIAFGSGFVILEYKPDLLSDWKKLLFSMGTATLVIWLIVTIGRSTYFLIWIRSGLDPIINENDPSTMASLLYYLNREQYGTTSLLSTALNRAAPIWDYQIKFMFLRYFGWNFIGQGLTFDGRGFIQESFALRGLLGLPFLVGITGFLYHSYKDWKKSFMLFVFFIFSGLLLVIYLNQPDPQPRERDYVYVGSFFVFAIWIGLGTYSIINGVKWLFEKDSIQIIATVLVAGSLVVICPILEFDANLNTNNRSGNYVPWDYSYNILMSCEENAIIFTNGDNDTFPIWYLQEVEGIRKDVKIVNLSLLNTPWYISQLKYYEPKISINLPDDQIENMKPIAWESRTLQIPVTYEDYEKFYREYNQPVPASLENATTVPVQVDPSLTVGEQTGIKVQDIMVFHIIDANRWQRPVYFAITVSPSFFLGFKQYLRLEGLVYRVTPIQSPPARPDILSENLMQKYNYRGIDDRDVFLDFGTVRLLGNYRQGFLDLSRNYINNNQKDKAVAALDFMTEKVPEFRTTNRDGIEIVGRHYYAAGKREEFRSRLLDLVALEPEVSRDKQFEFAGILYSAFQDTANSVKVYSKLLKSDPNDNQALGALIGIYESTKHYQEAITILEKWLETHPEDSVAQTKLRELSAVLESVTGE